MEVEYPVKDLDNDVSEEEEEEEEGNRSISKSRKKLAGEHKDQLQKLKEKDPEFYQFLQEHDEELLQFDDEDIEEDVDNDAEEAKMQVDEEISGHDIAEKEEKPSKNVITSAMVDSWCNSVREDGKIGALRSLMKAFRIACHYGDDGADDSSIKFTIMSSSVFNKIMSFVLGEMDGILRKLLGLPASGELLGVDLPTAYQHAFVFIRQLVMILRDAITMKTKESFRKVYEWKFINCLELWTGAICAYSSEADFRPLAYPLTQIISGVARLVPTARYFPLRLRCVRMLNRIAASAGTFIPVSTLLLDMLEMKELNRRPTGGVGKAIDLRTMLKVSKPTLKTRAYQEACVFSVIEELAEHLAQWSYSVAFFELSFVPAVRLRNFYKSTKVERFRKEIREIIHQVEANSKFTNEKRMSINFLPNDPAATAFLEDEKKSGASPLSRYVATLQQRAQQRYESLEESSVLVGEHSFVFGNKASEMIEDEDDDAENEKGAAIFSSSWLPGGESRVKASKEKKKTKKRTGRQQEAATLDEDVVEDLVLSSDEDGSLNDSVASSEDDDEKLASPKRQCKQRKPSKNFPKKKSRPKKSKKKNSACHTSSDGKGDKAKPVPLNSTERSRNLLESCQRRMYNLRQRRGKELINRLAKLKRF
ncbi:hypothetical protein GH714_011070 [Hevea brasiliensis]|uniref:Nucleolar complex protein 2 homolog n=1 Tax=Hevea brasiliensis TaxID=3981 RepID=A0A6A6M8K8_HEVBR|nr:hypothetical protein GH714_011070 [Hevea brasiliensis]